MRKSWILTLVTGFGLLTSAGAETFFVSNRPFSAVTRSQSGNWTARLTDLAPALSLPLTQQGQSGIYCLGRVPEDPLEGEPGVYFQGRRLTQVGPDLVIADLQAFMQELGGRYVVNKSLGTIDLYAPSKLLGKGVACNNVHVLMFHKPESSGQQVASLGDELWATRGLEPVPIDFEDKSHPLWQQWSRYWSAGPMPLVVVVDPAGRVLGRWSGQVPSPSPIHQAFSQFVERRAATNAQQVASPARTSGGFSGG